MNEIRIKKLHEGAKTPTRSHQGDSGLDLYALEGGYVDAKSTALIKTGIAVEVPFGYEAQVRPRSGVTLDTDIQVQLGTVDHGYSGDVGIIVRNMSDRKILIPAMHKLAQLVVNKIEIPSILLVKDFEEESERGSNGFGSTDKEAVN